MQKCLLMQILSWLEIVCEATSCLAIAKVVLTSPVNFLIPAVEKLYTFERLSADI